MAGCSTVTISQALGRRGRYVLLRNNGLPPQSADHRRVRGSGVVSPWGSPRIPRNLADRNSRNGFNSSGSAQVIQGVSKFD
jgi:hypothetical protein